MGGGLMELIARGVQDIFLIGNPQITFFKAVYRRHTNFAVQPILQTIDGTTDFGKKVTCKISRSGDLLSQLWLELDMPLLTAVSGSPISWVNSLGHALIEYVEIQIGGQTIDKQYGEWMEIWSELAMPESYQNGYGNMVSKYDSFTTVTGPITLYIPFQFWFCRDIGLALPLISLQYHEVEVLIKFREFDHLWTFGPNSYYTASKSGTIVTVTSGPEFTSADVGKKLFWEDGTIDIISELVDDNPRQVVTELSSTMGSQSLYAKYNDLPKGVYNISAARLYADYIYLDSYERKKFAMNRHEYLIEQLQFNGNVNYLEGQSSRNIDLDQFNLPVKELIWVCQIDKYLESNDLFNYSDTVDPLQIKTDPVSSASILFNGQDRVDERKGGYFRMVQPYQKHTRVPKSHIYVYSFALKPEQHQPTGSANFSKIDNKDLRLNFKTALPNANVRVYAVNYNVLRIINGMAGVAMNS
jgi:hypothetical protein